MPSEDQIVIYADGSCLGNPGRGGWGVIVIAPDGSQQELNGHDPSTTNNRMEITAAVEGLRATARGSNVVLRSDSQYVINTMKLGWKRNKNHDLWKLLDDEQALRRVTFEWVRGHNGDRFNDRADQLAVMGSNRKLVAES